MICGLLRVKNEARWISDVIASIRPLCKTVIVMDDHSEDETPRLCEEAGAKVLHSPFSDLQEGRDKQWLMEQAAPFLQSGRDWCLMIDGDEILHADDQQVLLADITSARAFAYSLRIVYLWDRPNQIRTDGIYGDFRRPSCWKYHYSQRWMVNTNGGGFHCSNIPATLWGQSQCSQARLLHLGYMHKADRLRKFDWYNSIKPVPEIEDGYRHMLIGDTFPADARFRWGGPLRLEPLR